MDLDLDLDLDLAGSGSWSQLGGDIDGEAAGDRSGYNVALSSDGSRVAVGAMLNDGAGGFAASADLPGGSASTLSVALGDVDGDHDLDVIVGNYGQPNQLLLNAGASVFKQDRTHGRNALHLAAMHGHDAVVKALLQLPDEVVKKLARATDKQHNTPLMLAARAPCSSAARALPAASGPCARVGRGRGRSDRGGCG